jgi:hypothetical protein
LGPEIDSAMAVLACLGAHLLSWRCAGSGIEGGSFECLGSSILLSFASGEESCTAIGFTTAAQVKEPRCSESDTDLDVVGLHLEPG